jgi:transposase
MIDRKTVFEIHRLKNAGYSARLIAKEMRLGRDTVRKYLEHPEGAVVPKRLRVSKLDNHRNQIETRCLKSILSSRPRWCFRGFKKMALTAGLRLFGITSVKNGKTP